MIRAGVLGHPISHSLSPSIHRAWLDRFGVEGAYEAIDPGPTDDAFGQAIERLRADGFAGVNVTAPFKAAALALADEADEAARRIGGANTLTFTGGRVRAANTDAIGFAAALAAHGVRPRRALVLGAGGTAPAVLAALAETDAVFVTNRTDAKADALAARFGRDAVPWAEREGVPAIDLLVNATTLGVGGTAPPPFDLAALAPGACVADCVYAPGETALVRAARARGLAAFDGLHMLVAQAVPGHRAWFGSDVPDALVAETVREIRG